MSKADQDNNLKLLHMLTEQLLLVLQNKPESKEDWDNHIEQILQLLDKRQNLITQVKGPYTIEEIQLGKKIIAMNKVIDQLLVEFHKLIEVELKQVQKSKLMHQKYNNTSGFSFDGTFIDEQG